MFVIFTIDIFTVANFTSVIFTDVVLTWCESQVRARKGAQRLVTEFGGMFAVLV